MSKPEGDQIAEKMLKIASYSCIVSTDVNYYMPMWRPALRLYSSYINMSKESGISLLPNNEGAIRTKARITGSGSESIE